MARISIPITGRLPSTLRLDPANRTVVKVLNRLSRPSLLALALDWLDENNAPLCAPYLRAPDEDEDDVDAADLYPPSGSLEDLVDMYSGLQARKGSKREVLDRILEGDWRRGLTMYQLAMADLQYLYDHEGSQTWSAYRIVALKTPTPQQAAEDEGSLETDAESLVIPRFHPATFLQRLQAQVLPDVKAHYNFDRPKDLPLLLLRIFVLDSPYNTNLATAPAGPSRAKSSSVAFDASRTIYIAFPDGSPYVYISKSQTVGTATANETRSLRALVAEGIPKALSRPQQRFKLQLTRHTTRNLQELLDRRGSGRTNAAGGGWGIYADEKNKESPLDAILPSPPPSEPDEASAARRNPPAGRVEKVKRAASPVMSEDERRAKRARLVAQARFGDSGRINDGMGIERLDIVVDDPFPEQISTSAEEEQEQEDEPSGTAQQGSRKGASRLSTLDQSFDRAREHDEGGGSQDDEHEAASLSWRPSVKMTFRGPHVFAGIRQLVEAGIIDGEKMPGWLTGEEGVTIGAVRHGRIRGHQGSGV